MMKKVLVIGITLFCLILAGAGNTGAVTMSVLIDQLRMRLAEDQIDFPDSVLENLVRLSYSLVIPHGLAYKILKVTYAASGQARIDVDGEVLFVSSVRIGGSENVRSLPEIGLKDLARRHINTSASSPQFFVFYRDIIAAGVGYGYVYLYPTPTAVETLQIVYYMNSADSDSPPLNTAYEENIVSFALFFAYLRKKDWQSATQVYNTACLQIANLREVFVNRKPDITIAPKELE